MTTTEYLQREIRRTELSVRRAERKTSTPPEELRGLEEKMEHLLEALEAMEAVANVYLPPPIGRCASCACWDENTCECEAAADIEAAYHKYTEPDFYCGEYAPKED